MESFFATQYENENNSSQEKRKIKEILFEGGGETHFLCWDIYF